MQLRLLSTNGPAFGPQQVFTNPASPHCFHTPLTTASPALALQGLGPEQLMDRAAAWVSARGSDVPSARKALEPILAPDFRLWDAYGLLPLTCAVAGDRPREEGQQQQQQPSQAVVMGGGGHVAPRDAVYDILDGPKVRQGQQVSWCDILPWEHGVTDRGFGRNTRDKKYKE